MEKKDLSIDELIVIAESGTVHLTEEQILTLLNAGIDLTLLGMEMVEVDDEESDFDFYNRHFGVR